ncbi:hypothetical protein ACFQRB_17050 [Halobaculum litoreum]|uniref:Uncharacterized protein n=1 Tax=Halobaculum litoreum TaxID=3031998 RepID=A0ABD5XUX3_9EURY
MIVFTATAVVAVSRACRVPLGVGSIPLADATGRTLAVGRRLAL